MKYKIGKLLPTINNPTISLGTMEDNGTPQDPVITIVPVSKRGMNFPSGKNHTDYIDKNYYYDIVNMLENFKEIFSGIDNVGVGQYGPYIWTEVDCEILFNQYGYISKPKRATTKIKTFEQLVISKYWL